MRYVSLDSKKDELLLAGRVLMMILFVLFGWQKLNGFSGTVAYMASTGAPSPELSAVIAVAVELVGGALIAVGFYTRPLALVFAVYTLATALIGHRYWALQGMDQYLAMINFYKNISIIGGLLLLAVTGPGRYSFDRK
ncbi:DoxX family protein [Burkholderia ambifaria]|jgi:putative oxidoreductase|uniref:DoxX family protein n=1 Tax=Burkholderia ambifaria (strain ATCC BAA-244 / DSM 16087 / CCUG 44356 / LMG 19182 / AMMD) TaxID=339670 RepID=Q0B2J3_BURCM|nr:MULTISPECIES: DoxX family protein [Burkholderia]MDP9586814.1 putative oxidoreductase [Burkholderia contaminans]ABI91630.1 DoxX family protein [Burkholderia ambifaria AMMD]AJY25908.1 SURF4 family protein [Burkholderia ambifaria AMMD]ELK6206671.1 DoxX family protein [Burkholderia ambifaria]MBR7933373.1 DoxX family protein [Burkholderia ambifaria]